MAGAIPKYQSLAACHWTSPEARISEGIMRAIATSTFAVNVTALMLF